MQNSRLFFLGLVSLFLVASCGGGDSSSSANTPPVAAAGNDIIASDGEEVTFDASGSTDSDGTIQSYEWKDGEIILSTETSFSTSDLAVGEHTITLTVTDDDGATAANIILVTIDKQISLNDTGIIRCANEIDNDLNCAQAGYPGQDAEYGRDVTHNDDSDGHAGFSFTKLDVNGNELPASATEWNCVKDNVTGLIWEVKTDDGGLRDKDNTYSWYNSDSDTNGGDAGTENGGTCPDAGNCDTEKYVASVNAVGLCGFNDWHMPGKEELRSIVNYGSINPAVDSAIFPNTLNSYYWTASPVADDNSVAWSIYFRFGGDETNYSSKDFSGCVRLVRSESN